VFEERIPIQIKDAINPINNIRFALHSNIIDLE
jgi:hypothetical protein